MVMNDKEGMTRGKHSALSAFSKNDKELSKFKLLDEYGYARPDAHSLFTTLFKNDDYAYHHRQSHYQNTGPGDRNTFNLTEEDDKEFARLL